MEGNSDACNDGNCFDAGAALRILQFLGSIFIFSAVYAVNYLSMKAIWARFVKWVEDSEGRRESPYIKPVTVVRKIETLYDRPDLRLKEVSKTRISLEELRSAILASENNDSFRNSSTAVQALAIEMSRAELLATYEQLMQLQRGHGYGDTLMTGNARAHFGDNFVVYRAAEQKSSTLSNMASNVVTGATGGIVVVVCDRFYGSGIGSDSSVSDPSASADEQDEKSSILPRSTVASCQRSIQKNSDKEDAKLQPADVQTIVHPMFWFPRRQSSPCRLNFVHKPPILPSRKINQPIFISDHLLELPSQVASRAWVCLKWTIETSSRILNDVLTGNDSDMPINNDLTNIYYSANSSLHLEPTLTSTSMPSMPAPTPTATSSATESSTTTSTGPTPT